MSKDRVFLPESQLSETAVNVFITELNTLCLKYGVFIGTSVETDSSGHFQSAAVEIGQTVHPKGRYQQTITLKTVEAFPC